MRNPHTLTEALLDVKVAVQGIIAEHADLLDFDPGDDPDNAALPLVHASTDSPAVSGCDALAVWPSLIAPTIATNVTAGQEATCAYQTAVTFNVRGCVCYDLDIEDPTPAESLAVARRYFAVIWTLWAGLLNLAATDGGLVDGVPCSDVTVSDPLDLGPREAGIICGTIAITVRLKAERISS